MKIYSSTIGLLFVSGFLVTATFASAQVTQSWAFSLGGYVYSMPCVGADGTIYVGTQNSGYFYAIDSNGNEKWHLYCDVYANPALSTNGTIYLVYELSNVGYMAAISPSGTVLWYCPQIVNGGFAPAVSSVDGTIYVLSSTNALLGVNPNGSIKWKCVVDAEYFPCSPPVVGQDGTIYCGFYNSALSIGRLYAIQSNGLAAKWYYQVNANINAPAIDSSGTIIFGVPTPVNRVYAVKSDKTTKWNVVIPGSSYYSDCLVYSAPVIGVDGTIYISSAARLYALNPTNGSTKWFKDNGAALAGPEYANGPVLDTNGMIYYGSMGSFGFGSVYAYNADGSQAWAYYIGSQVECPLTITQDGKILVGATDSLKLIALKGSGKPLANSVWPSARRNLANTASLDVGTVATPPPVFQAVKRTNNVLTFTWSAVTTKTYQLQYKTNLNQLNWNNLGGVITASSSTASTTDSIGVNKQRFYRVGLLP